MPLQRAGNEPKDASEKALYALLALLSSNHEGQQQFYKWDGVKVVHKLLESDPGVKQLRKVLDLVTDLSDTPGGARVSRSAHGLIACRLSCLISCRELAAVNFTINLLARDLTDLFSVSDHCLLPAGRKSFS